MVRSWAKIYNRERAPASRVESGLYGSNMGEPLLCTAEQITAVVVAANEREVSAVVQGALRATDGPRRT